MGPFCSIRTPLGGSLLRYRNQMRLGRQYGTDRLEAASARALRLNSYSYRTVKNILASAQDRLPFQDTEIDPTPHHANIRGAAYYTNPEEDLFHAH